MFSAFEKLKLAISDNSKISADYLTRESNSKLIIAIREALANSIIHCDFLNHKGVFIIRYPDRMIFINGGSLVKKTILQVLILHQEIIIYKKFSG